MKACTATLNRCDGASAEALLQAADTRHTIGDLTDQHLIGDVDEQAVLQHTGNVVDRLLQGHWIADAAVEQIKDGMVLGLGSGSTAALMIQGLGSKLASGELKDIVGVTTSFQGEVLAAELNIPLLSLNAVSRIDLAIDGADEVDPGFQLIKGGGACHVQEKLVAARADRFVVVVDSTKLVDRLNLGFLLPWKCSQGPGAR